MGKHRRRGSGGDGWDTDVMGTGRYTGDKRGADVMGRQRGRWMEHGCDGERYKDDGRGADPEVMGGYKRATGGVRM